MEGEEANGEKKTKFGFFHGQSISLPHLHLSKVSDGERDRLTC